ncbi:uncharacterized protein LOC131530725 isoform X2 [Onychostoma macrolepis]|nr:uncharacterized protein LOC131530725 isoform X2 [Onychostoma macrolepis]
MSSKMFILNLRRGTAVSLCDHNKRETFQTRASARPQHQEKPEMTREIGCQTEPVSSRSAATQARMRTGTLMEPFTECPGATSTPLKRKRCEVSTDDSSYHKDGSESTMNCTRVSNEVLPHKVTKYIVYEDKLLELFRRCPVCTWSCVASQTTIGTLLRVKQHCAHCEYSRDYYKKYIQ